MPVINEEKCIGCRTCQTYCSVDAILFEGKKCKIDPNLCTECYVCLRQKVCPEGAIHLHIDDPDFYEKSIRRISEAVDVT